MWLVDEIVQPGFRKLKALRPGNSINSHITLGSGDGSVLAVNDKHVVGAGKFYLIDVVLVAAATEVQQIDDLQVYRLRRERQCVVSWRRITPASACALQPARRTASRRNAGGRRD